MLKTEKMTNKSFKIEHEGGDISIDVLEHTKMMLDKYSDVKIYVGCDSQNKQRGCVYATVIAYRFSYGDSGLRKAASYIFHKESVQKQKDKFTRLWGEVERSVQVAHWLESNGFKVHQIDLDFNHKSNTGSHDLVASGSGYVRGFGFNVTCKPELQCATRGADHIVKKGIGGRIRYKGKKKLVS